MQRWYRRKEAREGEPGLHNHRGGRVSRSVQSLAALQGIRYDPARLGRLGPVLAPPYDVVSPESARAYLARSPYNVLRLDLGLRDEDESYLPGDWNHAGELFRRWLAERVLLPDPEPSVYVMRHHYRAPDGTEGVLTAAFAGLRAGSGPARAALPHERTLPEVWSERLRQLQTCRAHFSPILGVVADPGGAVREALQAACHGEPQCRDEGPMGGIIELWVHPASTAAGARLLDALAASLAEHPAIIADGHHRFEAASRLAEADGAPAAHRYVLAGLTPMEEGGLAILPIHRVIGPASDPVRERLRLLLYEYLTPLSVAELPRGLAPAVARAAAEVGRVPEILRQVRAALGRAALAVYWGRGQLEFLAEPAKAAWKAKNARPELPGAANDVLLLHRGPLAGFELMADLAAAARAAGAERGWVAFTPVAQEAAGAVEAGRAAAALFLSPVTLGDVKEVAVTGKRMPQKSTYFYPKLTSGLVMVDLEREVLPWPARERQRRDG